MDQAFFLCGIVKVVENGEDIDLSLQEGRNIEFLHHIHDNINERRAVLKDTSRFDVSYSSSVDVTTYTSYKGTGCI